MLNSDLIKTQIKTSQKIVNHLILHVLLQFCCMQQTPYHMVGENQALAKYHEEYKNS